MAPSHPHHNPPPLNTETKINIVYSTFGILLTLLTLWATVRCGRRLWRKRRKPTKETSLVQLANLSTANNRPSNDRTYTRQDSDPSSYRNPSNAQPAFDAFTSPYFLTGLEIRLGHYAAAYPFAVSNMGRGGYDTVGHDRASPIAEEADA